MKRIQDCIAEVRAWMISNKLMINDDKTEFLIIGSNCGYQKSTSAALPLENQPSCPGSLYAI